MGTANIFALGFRGVNENRGLVFCVLVKIHINFLPAIIQTLNYSLTNLK